MRACCARGVCQCSRVTESTHDLRILVVAKALSLEATTTCNLIGCFRRNTARSCCLKLSSIQRVTHVYLAYHVPGLYFTKGWSTNK